MDDTPSADDPETIDRLEVVPCRGPTLEDRILEAYNRPDVRVIVAVHDNPFHRGDDAHIKAHVYMESIVHDLAASTPRCVILSDVDYWRNQSEAQTLLRNPDTDCLFLIGVCDVWGPAHFVECDLCIMCPTSYTHLVEMMSVQFYRMLEKNRGKIIISPHRFALQSDEKQALCSIVEAAKGCVVLND